MNAFTCSSPLRSRRVVALVLLIVATAARAATFTVTNTNASGTGSLAQAITDANASAPGPNTINFNIAGPGVHTITGTLPVVTRAVTIDGYSQPGSAANTSATSDNAILLIELSGCELTLQGGGSTVKGLVINGGTNGITISSPSGATTAEPGNIIVGNFIGLNADGTAAVPCAVDGILIAESSKTSANIIGGTAPADRNVISGNTQSGIDVFGTNNQIYGNFVGLNAAGTAAVANGTSPSNFNSAGILIQGACLNCTPFQTGYASGTIIGGTATGAGNVISGNDAVGDVGIRKGGAFDPAAAAPTVVQGNYIGVDPTNTVNIPNTFSIRGYNFTVGGTTAGAGNVIADFAPVTGSLVQGNNIESLGIARNTVVGGHTAGAGNVIHFLTVAAFGNSGNAGSGVVVEGNEITGSVTIGVDPALISGSAPVSGATIGGTTPGAGNTIAGGITVNGIGTGNVFLSNSIGTTIDLAPGGPTANDPGDTDTGANNLQNFPVLRTAISSGGNTTVAGSLNSTPSNAYTVQFFSSPSADPSGHGPGETFLGTITVNTDANGNADFSTAFVVGVATGQVITATATSATDGTSEFSIATPVNRSSIQFHATSSKITEGAGSVSITVSRTNADLGAASVHFATADDSATAGADYTAAAGDLDFAAGETSKTIIIPILNDKIAEGPEVFTVVLSNPTNGAILQAPTGHTVTIVDNDPEPSITIDDAPAVLEGNSGTTPSTFTVSLSSASVDAVSVHYLTVDNTTTTGIDYTAVAGTLTFAPGETSKTITVLVIGDTAGEADEVFRMVLSNPGNASLARNFGNGSILNDDGAPTPTASASATPTISPTPTASPTPSPAARAQNLSTRLNVGSGEQQAIAGFIVTGDAPKKVIIRALGPSLTQFGLAGVLSDPFLELHGPAGELIATNDNWRDMQEAQIQATHVPPLDDHESAIVVSLPAGNYTAVIRGNQEGSGIGVVEIYDLDSPNSSSRLANISTRGNVGTESNVVIAGFILGGGDSSVVLRGIGPSLANAGVLSPLPDPTLQLHDADGALIFSDDNWRDDPQQAVLVNAAGLAPTDDREAGMALTLSPGHYTVMLAGKSTSTGVGLVEVYNLQ
jgi:Calx-beta domain-containing protein